MNTSTAAGYTEIQSPQLDCEAVELVAQSSKVMADSASANKFMGDKKKSWVQTWIYDDGTDGADL